MRENLKSRSTFPRRYSKPYLGIEHGDVALLRVALLLLLLHQRAVAGAGRRLAEQRQDVGHARLGGRAVDQLDMRERGREGERERGGERGRNDTAFNGSQLLQEQKGKNDGKN